MSDQGYGGAGGLPVRDEFISFLATVLVSMRRAIETPMRMRSGRVDGALLDSITEAVLEIERVAVPLKLSDRTRSPEARRVVLQRALENFREMRRSAILAPHFGRSLPRPIASRDNSPLIGVVEKRPIDEVLDYLIERTEAEMGLARGEQLELEIANLRGLVPAQKVAPVQFEMRSGRLAVLHAPRKGLPEDITNIDNAKRALLEQGRKIIAELERSNCDKRLLESLQHLQRELDADENAIQLGLSNIACEVMVRQFQSELPDAVFAMVQAHTRGVEMFAAQFPEWGKFVENAASTALAESDIESVSRAAAEVLHTLEHSPSLAEPEVPKTILRLQELLAAPDASTKRAGFAMLRTLENLISKIYTHCVDLLDQTATNTVKQLSKVAAGAIVATLLTMAVGAASAIAPIAVKVPEMQWLRSATEVIKRELQAIER